MKKHLLFLFSAFVTFLANAQTKVEIDGIWYNLISKVKQAEVTSDRDYSGSITIPATVTYEGKEYSVTSIGSYAFSWCSSLTSITISEGVTSIGNDAFQYCSSLTSITIPKSVTNIGEGAFYYCNSLAAVYISDIAAWCSIEFSNSSANPLCYAHNLYLNGELVTKLTIPEGVTNIGNRTFYGCSSLTDITIPEGVTSIGQEAFYECSSLTDITIPEGVTSIGNTAFSWCSSLTTINIPEGVKNIKFQVFEGCSSLTAITIPESVTSIEDYAFQYCRSLTSITIPESVTSIEERAFADCAELLDVYCYAESVPSTSADAFDGSYPEYITLHVPASALVAYKTATPWSGFGTIVAIEEAITNIQLGQSSAVLFEGESLLLTATITPDNATDKSIAWSSSNPNVAAVDEEGNVTAIAPGTAIITATANDGSGVSASCEVVVKEKLLGKCATPVVNYVDGQVVLTCATEDAKVKTFVVKGDDEIYEDLAFDLVPAYTLTTYATKEKYEDSEVVSITLYWIPCTEQHENGEADGIITIPSQPVLIQCSEGVLTLTGLAEGAEVAVYSIAGLQKGAAVAAGGTATIATDFATGDIAIVKIGGCTIKVVVK